MLRVDQIISKAARSSGLSYGQASDFFYKFLDGLLEAIANGDFVKVPGLGTIYPRYYPAKSMKNNLTGESIVSKPKILIKVSMARKAIYDVWQRSSQKQLLDMKQKWEESRGTVSKENDIVGSDG